MKLQGTDSHAKLYPICSAWLIAKACVIRFFLMLFIVGDADYCWETTESKVVGVGGYLWVWVVCQHCFSPWGLSWWWTPQTVSLSVVTWKKEKLCWEGFVALTTLSLSSWSLLMHVLWLERSSTLSGISWSAGTDPNSSFPLPCRSVLSSEIPFCQQNFSGANLHWFGP